MAIAIEELKTAPAKLTPILSVGIEVAPADCSDPSEITSSTVNLYVEITPKWMRDAEGARIAEFIWSHWSEHKADFMEKLGKKARSFQSREMNSPLVFKERVDAAIQCHTSMYSHVSIMVDASRVEISDMLSFHLRTQGHIPTCFKEDGSYVYPNAFHLGDNTRAVVQRYVGPSGNVEREIQKYKESLIPHMPINTLEPHEYNTNARIILFEYLALAKARSLKLKK